MRDRLEGYAGLYAEVFADGGRMCLCGVFAADAASLPAAARHAAAAFFDDQLRWVASLFQAAGLTPTRAGQAAQAYLAALEGALLLARARAQVPAGEPEPSGPPTRPDRHDAVVPSVSRTLLDALL